LGTCLNKIIFLSIGAIVIFVVIEKLRPFLPENLLEKDGIQIKTIGLMLIVILTMLSILISNSLNRFEPELKLFKVVLYTGLILFVVELFFKLFQNVVLFGNRLYLEYSDVVVLAMTVGGVGMLIANIRIHKLRNKSTLIPWLILMGLWVSLVLLKK